ncbi:bifunctional GNAT family N-acetyltransferase/hotdog fold thioesterase [Thalassotalea fusca]
MIRCKTPKSKEEFAKYFQFRWLHLRKAWDQPEGSEQDALESQAYHRMLIDAYEQIVAVGRLHFSGTDDAQIRYMAVAPEYQGKGLGKQLLDELTWVAQSNGAKSITLNARESAVPFYEKHGFQNLGFSHLLFNSINHFKMSKPISTPFSEVKSRIERLEQVWHQTIPMSKAMNINICSYDRYSLLTTCDIEFNKNLHNTMFAGSIYTLATLTGWAWVYFKLQETDIEGDIVLADGHIKYLAPVPSRAVAQIEIEDTEDNLVGLAADKKARFLIKVSVKSGDRVCAQFTGKYVAIRAESKQRI